jgi:hypothetical protein
MRVPSFLTKSASSTPATWVLVLVYALGADLLVALSAAGAPVASARPKNGPYQPPDLMLSSCSFMSRTA